MTGPEHYEKAQKLLADAAHSLSIATANTINEVAEMAKIAIATAQVHATLALAAAGATTVEYEPLRFDGGYTR